MQYELLTILVFCLHAFNSEDELDVLALSWGVLSVLFWVALTDLCVHRARWWEYVVLWAAGRAHCCLLSWDRWEITLHIRAFSLRDILCELSPWPFWKPELCTRDKKKKKKEVLCTGVQDMTLEIRMGRAVWDTNVILSTICFSLLYRWLYWEDQWQRTEALPMLLSRPGSSTVPWGRTFCLGRII